MTAKTSTPWPRPSPPTCSSRPIGIERPPRQAIPLGSLQSQARAEIIEIDERCQGFTRRRFLDLGLTPGTPIYPELDNAFREPRAYRVRGTLIALRKDQARLIWVRPVEV